MRLAQRTIYGIMIFLVGLILVLAHPEFHGAGTLSPFYALKVGGGYLLSYSVLMAATCGLVIRLLKGTFFAKQAVAMKFPAFKK